VLISTVIYIGLQVGFLVALRPADLAQGWARLSFTGQAGPFAGLAAALGLSWTATLLYIDAYISPGGTGLIYVTAGARILFAVGEMNAGPRSLTLLNEGKAPWVAVLVMWLVGILFLAPFPAWQLMVNYATSITVLTYGLGPIVLLVLRRSQPTLTRPFRLWGADVVAPVAFVCSNWIIYWTGFKTNSFMFAVLAIGFALYAGYYHFAARKPVEEFGWRYIAWLLPWFGGMWVISALGDIDGGSGVLGFWPCVAAVTIWSVFVIFLALRSALPAEETAAIMVRMREMP
jgi:amino acid transporter